MKKFNIILLLVMLATCLSGCAGFDSEDPIESQELISAFRLLAEFYHGARGYPAEVTVSTLMETAHNADSNFFMLSKSQTKAAQAGLFQCDQEKLDRVLEQWEEMPRDHNEFAEFSYFLVKKRGELTLDEYHKEIILRCLKTDLKEIKK